MIFHLNLNTEPVLQRLIRLHITNLDVSQAILVTESGHDGAIDILDIMQL